MVYSRELIAEVARYVGLPLGTAEQHYRRLHSLGYITKGGRGRSAADMSDRDAIRLLLSMAISESPAEGSDRVGDFEKLQLLPRPEVEAFGVRFTTGTTLGDILAMLMAAPDFRSDPGQASKLNLRVSCGTAGIELGYRGNFGSSQPFELPFNTADFDLMGRMNAHNFSVQRTTCVPLDVIAQLASFVRSNDD